MDNSIKKQDNSLAKTSAAEKVYRNILKTSTALNQIYIDGEGHEKHDKEIVARQLSKYVPTTEDTMLLSNVLPMSDVDVEMARKRKEYSKSYQFLKDQLESTSKTLEETSGSRIRVAYRLIRYFMHMRGISNIGEPSIFTMRSNTPEFNFYTMPIPYDPMEGWYRGLTAPRTLLEQVSNDDLYKYTYLINNKEMTLYGMSMLPPDMADCYFKENPALCRKNEITPEDYDPLYDTPLQMYLNIMEFLADHLGIGKIKTPPPREHLDPDKRNAKYIKPTDDRAALVALLNPVIARLAWPCSDDLETYEEYVLIPYVERKIVEKSALEAENELKAELGLTHVEAVDLIEIAKTYAQEAHAFDPDRERSIQISKLQSLAGRCRNAGMVTTELNSHKTILQVLGLTRHDEDNNVDKRDALRTVLEEKLALNSQEDEENQ